MDETNNLILTQPNKIQYKIEEIDDQSEDGGDKAIESEENQFYKIYNDFQSGDPFIDLPESYKYQTFNLNPFMNNELLFKTVIKRDQLFFFIQIYFTFEQSLEQIIFFEQALNHSYFTLKADSMIYKSGWDSEITLTFEQFIDKLIKPYTEFSFFKFLYTKGFTSKQKIAIKKGLEKDLQVKDCQFILNWNDPNEYIVQPTQNNKNNMDPISQFTNNDYVLDQDNNGEIQEDDSPKSLQLQNQDISLLSDDQKPKLQQVHNQTQNQSIAYPQNIVSFTDLNFIIDRSKKIEKLQNKIQSPLPYVSQEKQQFQNSIHINDQFTTSAINKYGDKNVKNQIPKLPVVINDASVVEFKSNLDVKILKQQGLTKLNNYETPAREEDYIESFNLLNLNDLVVVMKYIRTEQKSFHKILIYKPMSKTPLCSCDINDINILERYLNLKWLDIQTISRIQKQNKQLRRKCIEPQINQGLVSIDNLKKIIFSYFFQVKEQMNGKIINLKPIFSVENQRIRHNFQTSRNQRLQDINNLLLENIKKNKSTNAVAFLSDDEDLNTKNTEKMQIKRNFIQHIKYAIVSYDISNDWQSQQNEILQKYFEKKTVIDYAYINNAKASKFKVFMNLTIFRTLVHLNLEKIVYLRLDVAPLTGQRNKQFKIIFELADIVNLFERSFSFEKCFDEIILFRIIQKISKSLVYSKSQVYKSFSLPLSKINPQLVDRHQFCLINRYSLKPPQYLIPKEISKKSFLDLIQCGERVLYQGVKRLLNTYAIVTIGYYTQLDYYYMQIYLPFNCRRFTNTFYTSNLANLTGEYMNQIFKEKIAKNNIEELNKAKDYSQFYRKIVKLDPSKLHSNRVQQQQQKQVTYREYGGGTVYQSSIKSNPQILQNSIEESLDSSTEQIPPQNSSYANPNIFLDLIKPNSQQNLCSQNFIQLQIWEEIVRSMEVSIDNTGEMLITIENYSGIMREYLTKSIVNFSGNKNGLFEVLIRFKDQKSKSDIYSSPSIQINDNNEIKLDMYVRINFFQKVNSINEKILLRQILFSYYNNNRLKFRNIPKDQQLQHNFMNQISSNQNDNQQQLNDFNTDRNQNYHNQYPNTQRHSNLQNQTNLANQDYYLHSPTHGNSQGDDQTPYLKFSECNFDHSDLINISYLLLDRIRTSIQEKQQNIMKFYDHQNEVFETGLMENNFEINEPTPLPPAQLQINQNVASAYLVLNELPKEPISILKRNIGISKQLINADVEQNEEIYGNTLKVQTNKNIMSSHMLDQITDDAEMNIVNQLINGGEQIQSQRLIKKKKECLVDRKARKKIKMNNNININELLDSENRQLYMKTLYRGIFTVRPLQIIAIFYYKKFYVQIYNTINGKNLITDLSFTTVEHQIPYLQHMLKLELYQEIGKRIFFSFKNRLMMKSYPELIDY